MQTKTSAKKLVETRIKEYNKGETQFTIGNASCNVRVTLGGNSYLCALNINEYRYCCGFRELGNIAFSKGVELTENLERDLLTKFLRQVRDRFVDTEANTRIGLSFTVPINQPTVGHYDLFIEAALKIGFREVAEFTNKNSNNLLKHFILA